MTLSTFYNAHLRAVISLVKFHIHTLSSCKGVNAPIFGYRKKFYSVNEMNYLVRDFSWFLFGGG